ncbi:hypothetical protein HH214_06190 [Mucilaginibacter robiniae]|uniref:Uncharacterized protein n=1 Tax=Mucilaginibacter robiniae TaxID=2728022 RepID=A0A7L5DWM5_9SPHI|nr:hypothetical protein [Mucilaginibacter robiniae]QJD95492.1 hypothetical protein HH214_06190 [Mucilaginibacter robiniae]
MKKNSLFRYYRVFKNDTTVTEISTNNFKLLPALLSQRVFPVHSNIQEEVTHHVHSGYILPDDSEMFYGYASKTMAMRKAKAGALQHINRLIAEVTQGINKLKTHRALHYQDLNDTLLESNIRKLEREMYIK